MAGDFVWIMHGSTDWSGEYRGKDAVRRELLRLLTACFCMRNVDTAVRSRVRRLSHRDRMAELSSNTSRATHLSTAKGALEVKSTRRIA